MFMRKAFSVRKPKRIRQRRKLKLFVFIIFSVAVVISVLLLSQLDKRLMPSAISAADIYVKTLINNAINNAVIGIINERELTATDFYKKSNDPDGNITSLYVNTILANEVCNRAAVDISKELSALGIEKIRIPIGAILGIGFFANTGPSVTVNVMPLGNASVDYKTSFKAAGINQINFQVWLQVESYVRIINPLQSFDMTVEREVPLVDTIFAGQVPNAYINEN